MQSDYDVIIIGGGPAGTTCALYGARLGLKILLIDKKTFPRDKICGDAISGKSVYYLRELDLLDEMQRAPQVLVRGIIFSSPNGTRVNIPFTPPNARQDSYGFVCRREVFDNILFTRARSYVDTLEGFTVTEPLLADGRVCGVIGKSDRGTPRQIAARVVIGADGFNSIIARKLGFYALDAKHHVTATRGYYRGITGLTDSIEIHFVRDILPGYFWIFPLDNGLANVGIGMLHRRIKRRRLSLREEHIAATRAPYFRERFEHAELVGGIHGWNLPMGSKQRRVHGEGFMLVGDAAGLIDPFSGEGIGNAMCSGKIAAEVAAAACARQDTSAAFLQAYADRLWDKLWSELRTSYAMQKFGQVQPLLNLVVGRAQTHKEIRDWISAMMAGTASRRALTSPWTYLHLLFNPRKMAVPLSDVAAAS